MELNNGSTTPVRIVPHGYGRRDDDDDNFDDLGSPEPPPPAASTLPQAEASEGAADQHTSVRLRSS